MPVYRFQPRIGSSSKAGGIMAGIVGLGVLALTFFVGFFVILFLVAVGALAAVVLQIRLWWLQRKGGVQPQGAGAGHSANRGSGGFGGRSGPQARSGPNKAGDVLEGEFEVVDPDKD